MRDYIHVVDLALGHIKALDRLLKVKGCEVYNLGTGKGYSVLDVVKAFEKASGIKINYRIAPRRAVMSPAAMRTRQRQRKCLAGRRSTISTICAPTRGAGSRRTPTAWNKLFGKEPV